VKDGMTRYGINSAVGAKNQDLSLYSTKQEVRKRKLELLEDNDSNNEMSSGKESDLDRQLQDSSDESG